MEVSDLMYSIQEVVYNFRMPVFFVLSGIFLAAGMKKKTFMGIFRNRAGGILYPYLVWGSIMIIMQIIFSGYTNSDRTWKDLLNLIVQPRGIDHLWYLLALFNTNILYLILARIIKNNWIHAVIAIVLYYLSRSPLTEGNSFIADMFYFYIYLFVGAMISHLFLDKEKRERYLKFVHICWLLPVVIVGQYFWYHYWKMENYAEEERKFLFLFALITLFACYLVYIISFKISTYKSADWLAYLGKHSLYIYILHVFVASAVRNVIVHFQPGMNTWLVAFICWICGLLVPVALFRLLRPLGFKRLFSLNK